MGKGKSGSEIVKHYCTSRDITLYQGDFFDLDPSVIGQFDIIIDRAALVALHPSMVSTQYLPLVTSLMSSKLDGLMFFASVS